MKLKFTFWSFVAGILMLYGVLIFSAGIYYLVTGSTDPTTHLHPSIWWGAIMFVAGLLFLRLSFDKNG